MIQELALTRVVLTPEQMVLGLVLKDVVLNPRQFLYQETIDQWWIISVQRLKGHSWQTGDLSQ